MTFSERDDFHLLTSDCCIRVRLLERFELTLRNEARLSVDGHCDLSRCSHAVLVEDLRRRGADAFDIAIEVLLAPVVNLVDAA